MPTSAPILITGATGSIGAVLARRLTESGRTVRALVRNPDKAGRLRSLPNVELVAGDLAQAETLAGAADGCALVYHLAAAVASSSWEKSRAANVDGTRAIVEEAVRAKVGRFVYASTIGVYGISPAELITEDTPWTSLNAPYFVTKQEAERIVWAARDRFPVVVARPGDVIGPGQYVWTLNLVDQMRRGLLMPPIPTGWLNPVYIDNLIDALVLLGEHPAAVGEVFNVTDGAPIRSTDFFACFLQMIGRRPMPMPAPLLKVAALVVLGLERVQGQDTGVAPATVSYLQRKGKIYPTKLTERLGWRPRVGQVEAFRRTEEWLRKEGYLAWTKRTA